MSDIGPVLILAAGLSPEREVSLREANVMPGLTKTSTLPMAVASAGLDLGAVFRDLLAQAAEVNSTPFGCDCKFSKGAMPAGAMTAAGFVNYPADRRHWPYGEQC